MSARPGNRRGFDATEARRSDDRGFTLLEVLIAFVIAALALAVLYRGSAEGLLGSRQAVRTEEAVARARSRLTALCEQVHQTPGEQSGSDGDGYSWRTQVTPAGSETIRRGDPSQPASLVQADLFAVQVTVSWPGTTQPHRVSLETRCLTASAANQP
jgi:general secretion pathway protein I